MERIYREQPKNEDVRFVTIPEQMGAEYRPNFEGGMGEIDNLPVDTMEGLVVSTVIPEGYYAEVAKEDAQSQDGTDEPVEGDDIPTVEGEIENPTEEEGEF